MYTLDIRSIIFFNSTYAIKIMHEPMRFLQCVCVCLGVGDYQLSQGFALIDCASMTFGVTCHLTSIIFMYFLKKALLKHNLPFLTSFEAQNCHLLIMQPFFQP